MLNVLDLADMRLVLNRHGRRGWKVVVTQEKPNIITIVGDTGRNHAFIGPMADGRWVANTAMSASYSVLVRETLPATLESALHELRHVP